MTQGTDSMSYPGKGYMAWGLAGPLSMIEKAYHDGSGDPVPNPDPFKPPGESWLLLSTTKRLQEPQATGSYGQLLGTHISQI